LTAIEIKLDLIIQQAQNSFSTFGNLILNELTNYKNEMKIDIYQTGEIITTNTKDIFKNSI
jgi:hypothetical protein